MILDRENIFFEKNASDLTANMLSDVIQTGGGNAVNPMYLYVGPALESGDIDLALEISDDEAFSSPTTIIKGSFSKEPIRTKLPIGLKKFMRLKVTESNSPTGGKITAALVVDVDFK